MKIAHLSDTHFGTEIDKVVIALEQTLRAQQPDLVILSGDITQRARRSQFIKARLLLEAINLPYLNVPGNHDIPLFDLLTRFSKNPYRIYNEFFGDREFIKIQDNIALVGLDATSPYRHRHGRVDLKHVGKLLTSAREKIGADSLLIVCVHQPLMTAWKQDRSEEMKDRENVAKLFAEFHVDAVLSGHVHVPLICTSDKAYPDLTPRFIHSGAGTATSHRTRWRKPNSFNMLTLDAPTQSIDIIKYDYLDGSFANVEAHAFRKNEQGLWNSTETDPTGRPHE